MLGAFAYWQLHVDWGWPIPLALASSLLVLAPGARRAASSGGSCAASSTRPRRSGSSSRSACSSRMLGHRPSGSGRPQEVYRVPLLFPGRARRASSACNVTYHDLIAFVVAVAGGHRAAAAAVPHPGRPRHARQRRQPAAGDAARRPARTAPPPSPGPSAAALAALAGILVGPLDRPAVAHEPHAADRQRLRRRHVRTAAQPADDVRRRGVPRASPTPTPSGTSRAATPTSSSFRFVIPVVVLFVVLLVLPEPAAAHPLGRDLAGGHPAARPGAPRAVTAAAIVGVALVLASVLSDADALRASRIFGIALIALSLVPLTGLRRTGVAVPDELRRHRRDRHGAPRARRRPDGAAARRGRVRGGRRPRRPPRAAPLRALPGAGHGRVRGVPRPVGLPLPVLRPRARGRSSSSRAACVAVDPLDIPGIDTTEPADAARGAGGASSRCGYLLVVAVRRSGFGQRLLAMKDSPAACATLGIDVTRLKLACSRCRRPWPAWAARSTPARSAR